MPIRQKKKSKAKYLIITVAVILVILMIISFGAPQNLIETVLHPANL